MSFSNTTQYTLGIDCYPSGTFAAIAESGKISQVFTIEENSEPIPSLTLRTQSAIAQAEELLGRSPDKVAIACIDDGGDGTELESIKHDCKSDCLIETNQFTKILDEYNNKLDTQMIADNATLSAIRATRTAADNS